jgi:hypothetical protein
MQSPEYTTNLERFTNIWHTVRANVLAHEGQIYGMP